MKASLQNCVRALSILCILNASASAQLVSVRTAPVIVAEQFFTVPSRLLGMGGGLALIDAELDPFANPAAGDRLRGGIFASTPTLYSLPNNDGFGRTLPVSMMYGGTGTFAGAAFAAQELESAHLQNWWAAPTTRGDRFSHNKYFSGFLGSKLPNNRGAIGFAASYANLESVHAVDLLYPQADAIDQQGSISDFRAGYLKDLGGERSVEAVIVRNHVDMEHTVTYVERRWSPTNGQMTASPPRNEYNRDKTTTLGAHLKYLAAIPQSKWIMAGAVTANLKSHPKIPNYEFMSVPRDPGDSWAWRFAVGAAKTDSISTIAFDVSYEPAWTYTWAEAADPIVKASGDTLPRGAMTIDNDFAFSNTNFHFGWMRKMDRHFGLQAGLGVRHITYWLDQYNYITERPRQQDESWTEVTVSWGATMNLAGLELRYFGRRSGGGIEFGGFATEDSAPVVAQPDIVAAPSGPLNMQVTNVWTHQLGVSIPFGRRDQAISGR